VTHGHEVVSVDLTPSERQTVEQVAADLRDETTARELLTRWRPTAVVHLAAIAVPFSAPDAETVATNTALAMNVLGGSVAAGVERVLVASSPTVIGYGNPRGWTPHYLPIDEKHPVAPWNAYALSKLMVEEIVRMFAVADTGDRVFGAFRPCFVIAPEEWSGAPTQQGHTVQERLADPELARVSLFNYVDARDAGDFVRLWTERATPELSGETFFVGAKDAMRRDGKPAAFAIDKAARLLGWHPQRSWRTELQDHSTTAPAPATAEIR
jgi:UDP-glucose 4-epimerase